VALQLVLIAVAGVLVVTRLPIWAFVDERAHAAYVDAMGSGHLPLLGKDVVPAEIVEAGGRASGFTGMSYEAFQPPLYYAVAAVAWDPAYAVGGTVFAVRVIRALDLLALAVAVALVWALARRVASSRGEALVAFAVALSFVAWPGVVFRSVTVSNSALEMPLASGALLALWIAWAERSSRALLLAAVLCGLGLLCRRPFAPVVALPIVAWRFRRPAPRLAVAALAIPIVLVAPWLLDNLHRYGALTASSIVREMQGGFLNRGDKPYGLVRLAHVDLMLLNGLLPEEWSNTTLWIFQTPHSLPLSILHALRGALVALILVPFIIWITKGPRRVWLLVAPLLFGIALTQLDTIAIRLPLVQPRYLYPVLPAFGLAAGLALAIASEPHTAERVARSAAGGESRRGQCPSSAAHLT
jgi:Dolichyl-phosphate-mannose-protein mannosyltransferase